MISCSQAVQRLWEYLEDEVSARERGEVEDHLAFCRRCCGEVEFAEELRSMLAAAGEVELPAGTEARLTRVLDDLESARHDSQPAVPRSTNDQAPGSQEGEPR